MYSGWRRWYLRLGGRDGGQRDIWLALVVHLVPQEESTCCQSQPIVGGHIAILPCYRLEARQHRIPLLPWRDQNRGACRPLWEGLRRGLLDARGCSCNVGGRPVEPLGRGLLDFLRGGLLHPRPCGGGGGGSSGSSVGWPRGPRIGCGQRVEQIGVGTEIVIHILWRFRRGAEPVYMREREVGGRSAASQTEEWI